MNEQQGNSGVDDRDTDLRYEPAPLRVFVVWHPKYAPGEKTFEALYEWLGGPDRNLYHRGLGVPVQAWTSTSDEDPPLKIRGDDRGLTIVVPILDGEFLGRKLWRDWIAEYGTLSKRSEKSFVVLPWAVHQAAPLIPGIGLLHLLGSGDCDTRQLCRRVTEACVVRIRDPDPPKPIRIFISYARQDGSGIAAEVRRALHNYGHLSPFLDEHDLQPGQSWKEDLASEMANGAAMFAIVTDAYASRAWCREELRKFREPEREENSNLWNLRPVYILDSLSGRSTRSMFEVGNAPAARWNPDNAADVVDQLIREMLFAEVNRAAGSKLVEQHPGVEFINWAPDTWTLLQVLHSEPNGKSRSIAYPGDGLPRIELDRLTTVFPGLTLVSFEELRRRTGPSAVPKGDGGHVRAQSRSPVLLSVSNPSPDDLAHRGIRPLHLDDAAVRIARALLFDDFDVMYGGRPREGFTKGFQDDSGAVVLEARFINYLGWPHTLQLKASQIADGFGATRYVRISRPGEASAASDDPWAVAEAATHTRRAIVRGGVCDVDGCVIPRPAGLVALGGQTGGFAGFLPGVAEEIAVALEQGVAVYVLGGFGGAARQAAVVMSGEHSDAFTVDRFMKDMKYRALNEAAGARGSADELSRRLQWLLDQLAHSSPKNGLTQNENVLLWTTENVGEAVALVSKGLKRVHANHKPDRATERIRINHATGKNLRRKRPEE